MIEITLTGAEAEAYIAYKNNLTYTETPLSKVEIDSNFADDIVEDLPVSVAPNFVKSKKSPVTRKPWTTKELGVLGSLHGRRTRIYDRQICEVARKLVDRTEAAIKTKAIELGFRIKQGYIEDK